MWDRRQFLTGLGLATLDACTPTAPTPLEPKPGPAPRLPPADAAPADATMAFGEPLDPGFRRMGRSPLLFDGEDLLELASTGLVRRDGKLVETVRVPLRSPQSLALMVDRSLVVLAGDQVHHVVNGVVSLTVASRAKLVLPTDSAKVYWAVAPTTVKRTELGDTGAKVDFFLPENAAAMTAQVTSDGRLLVADLESVLRIDRAIERFAWDSRAELLAAGPDGDTVWCAHPALDSLPARLVLRVLAKSGARPRATHSLAPGEAFVHTSSAGTDVAAIVARTVGANEAALSLVVFDANGERWRAALGDSTGGYFVALSPTRVVVQGAGGRLRAWNRATGTAVS